MSSSYFAFPRKQRAMSTGDVGGNLRQLQQDLRALRYPAPFDERLYVARARAPPPLLPALGPLGFFPADGARGDSALEGDAVTLLPVLHYLLLGFSRHVARFIASTGYEVRMRNPNQQRAPAWDACVCVCVSVCVEGS